MIMRIAAMNLKQGVPHPGQVSVDNVKKSCENQQARDNDSTMQYL